MMDLDTDSTDCSYCGMDDLPCSVYTVTVSTRASSRTLTVLTEWLTTIAVPYLPFHITTQSVQSVSNSIMMLTVTVYTEHDMTSM